MHGPLNTKRFVLLSMDFHAFFSTPVNICCSRVNVRCFYVIVLDKKAKQSLYRPGGFQEVEAPRFQDNQHKKVLRLLALRTDRLYPPENIPGTHFC